MQNTTRYVGLDVHKEIIAVAVCDESGFAQSLGNIPNTPDAVAQLMRKLAARGSLPVSYTHLDVYKRQGLVHMSRTVAQPRFRSARISCKRLGLLSARKASRKTAPCL